MGLFTKEKKYKVIREKGKKPRVVPINFNAMEYEAKQRKRTDNELIKEHLQKHRKQKSEARRKKWNNTQKWLENNINPDLLSGHEERIFGGDNFDFGFDAPPKKKRRK